jgi:methionyl-tRNA formyltransferase
MRVVFFGSGAFAVPTLKWLAQSEHELALVVTQPARGAGRGRRRTRTPIAAQAAELELPLLEPEDVNEPETLAQLRALDARVGVVIAFGQKLGAELLDSFPGHCINSHASLLPKYRGAAPINWALIEGETRTGVTVFRLVERMDAGPILTTRWTDIKPEETAGELHDRLAGIGVDAMRAALDLYADGSVPAGEPQDDSLATRAPKLRKTDGIIDFDQPAASIASHINGMSPWPGGQTRFISKDGRFENLIILRARVAEAASSPSDNGSDEDFEPGTIDSRRFVTTGEGSLEILEVKPSSGRVMGWPDYVNGRHVGAGDWLEPPPQEEPAG